MVIGVCVRLCGVEVPLARYAFQLGDAAFLELEQRSCDEVLDRRRDEDFPRCRLRRDPCADVDSEAGDLLADELALARVHSGADFEPDAAERACDCLRAADCSNRPVEAREESVACGIDLPSAETDQLAADECVVPFDKLAPAGISEFGQPGR